MNRSVLAATLLAGLATLSACGKSDNAKQAQTVTVVAAPKPITKPDETVPLGMLPRDATPLHYALTLTVDPKKPRFDGHAEIDVMFASARKTLFIDGRDLR